MPTNETPSAGAVARAIMRDLDDAMKSPRMGGYFQGDVHDPHRSVHIVQRHLDAFAREREAAVVREAHPYLRHQDTCGYWSNPNAMSDYKCTCGLVQFRTRAVEARRNG